MSLYRHEDFIQTGVNDELFVLPDDLSFVAKRAGVLEKEQRSPAAPWRDAMTGVSATADPLLFQPASWGLENSAKLSRGAKLVLNMAFAAGLWVVLYLII